VSTDVRIDDRGLAEFLRAIARIPSINPPGGEGPVAELIAGQLRDLGFGVEVFEAAPGRPSVVAKLPGRGQGPSFMLNGHMDVQPAGGGWKHDPFGAEMEGDRLFGRGVIDMKAGLGTALLAIRALHAHGSTPHVVMLWTTDE
jgi:succinyl-diaminopimelate desuccinylase